MAKFHGMVGYGTSVETSPGVWEDTIEEHEHFGDVTRSMRKLTEGDEVNSELSVSNAISIVADAFALENMFSIRYVLWMGTRWVVTNVEVQRPRLIMQLGEVYNGPTPAAPVGP